MSTKWNRDFYKTGYEGFEQPESYSSDKSMRAYRQLLLEKTAAQVAFISNHLGSKQLRVIEFGSGNGRLLVALALQGMLESGVGVEISHSRVAFAQRWTDDLHLSNIRFAAADALTFSDYEVGDFDLAVCITGALGYFRPIAETAPAQLLSKMRTALAPTGKVLLELYQMPEQRRQMFALNGGKLRLWQPLPSDDPFAYYPDDFEYWADDRILRHGKIFIGRDGTIDSGREEVLAYYSQASLSELLQQNGFECPVCNSDFGASPYVEGESATLVALADKVALDTLMQEQESK